MDIRTPAVRPEPPEVSKGEGHAAASTGSARTELKNFSAGLMVAALLLTGCASNQMGGIGSADDDVSVIKLGVIESVTPIEMDASSSGGATAGSVFGQVGGAGAGGGRGSAVGSVLGSVLGGTLGHRSGIDTKPGLEIWIRLDDEGGKSAYVMQPGKPDAFRVGDRVRVVRKKGETYVEPETAATGTPKEPPRH